MPPQRRRLLFAAIPAILLIIYYALLIFSAKPQDIEKELTHSLETVTSGQFQSKEFKLSYFPTLKCQFLNAELQVQDPTALTLKAKKINFHFGFLGFLFGKTDLSEVQIEEASLQGVLPSQTSFKNFSIENLKVKAKMLHSFKRIRVQWKGDLGGVKDSFTGKSILEIENPEKKDWNQLSLSGDMSLKNFPLAQIKSSFLEKKHIQIKEGLLTGQYHLQKEKNDPWIFVSGNSQMTKLAYEVHHETNSLIAPVSDADFELEAGWQPLEEQILIKRSALNVPFGKIQASGRVLLGERELKEVRLTFSDLMLEILPQYYLPFREAVPFNLGFSGKSNLEMSLEGALDHLSFHGNWDLTPTFLSYSRFFSKSKDIACNLGFDLLLKNNQLLGGDFSLKMNEAGFKGSLVNFDMKSGGGDLNILSNKFLLERWLPLLPSFSGYNLGGEIKILANFSGSLLQHPENVKTMVNVILEKGKIEKGPNTLKNIYFALDYSPLSLEVKQGQVQAGDYPLFFNATVFDPKTQPHAKLNFRSDQADLTQLLVSLHQLEIELLPEPLQIIAGRLRTIAEKIIPQGQSLRQFQADLETKGNEITLNELKAQIYEGNLQMSGKITPNALANLYSGSLEIDHLNLARFFSRNPQDSKLMNGNLFVKGDFQGKSLDPSDWKEEFSGKGAVSITNGEFNSFSMIKTISEISGLSVLGLNAPETTLFDDFQTEFEIGKEKIKTEKVSLISRDLKVSGDGEVTFSGVVNYKLSTYLSVAATKDVLGDFLGGSALEEKGEYLGPIPMLLSGAWDQPELKTDPSEIAEFTENLAKKKTQKVLRNFLPEDVLFDRPKSS